MSFDLIELEIGNNFTFYTTSLANKTIISINQSMVLQGTSWLWQLLCLCPPVLSCLLKLPHQPSSLQGCVQSVNFFSSDMEPEIAHLLLWVTVWLGGTSGWTSLLLWWDTDVPPIVSIIDDSAQQYPEACHL